QKDWGATREITAGYRVEGKPFHLHVHRRKHAVNHGVWKHYKLQFVDPDQTLRLRLSDLQPLPGGRMAFTLTLDANLDVWSRAKVYQYGVHLIALEVEGDMKLHLEIHGEVGLQATVAGGAAAIAVQPLIHDAKLSLEEFHIRRVSNANGPIVRELSGGVRSLVEDELNGPQLAAKLNRAIDKKRDRLVFAPADLLKSGWWPLSREGEAPAEPLAR
ncbi:MAG: hypothetical protein H0T51_00850, partial [Pirellulales bacterium]|nr:hypothetical protein [Pirellulales bacterium]